MATFLLLTAILTANLTVGAVKVEGVKALSKREIKNLLNINEGDKYFSPLYNSNKLKLLDELAQRGYFDAQIVEEKIEERENKVFLYLKISEGQRYRINSIQISWINSDTTFYQHVANFLNLPLPRYYSYSELAECESKASEFLRNLGYLNAEIQRTIVSNQDDKTCEVKYTVRKGTRYKISRILIDGNSTVRRTIIERELKVKPGQYVSPAAVLESIRRIYITGLFSTVYHTYEFHNDSLVSITFHVKERRSRYIKFQGGLYPFSLINLNAEGGNRNLLDNNQSITLRIESSIKPFNSLERIYGEALYTEPYFLSTPLKINVRLFAGSSKIDSTSHIGAESFLSYYWTERERSIIGLEWRKLLGQRLTDGIINKAIFNTVIDKRNNLLFPTKGYYLWFDLSKAGGILGGNYNFFEYQIIGSLYKQVWKPGGIIAFRVSRGHIVPFKDSKIPTIEKFKIGGDGTLRGYDYSRFYSSDYVLLNAELRAMLSSKIGINLLVDVFPESGSKVWYSAGIGFRYFLPIGSLRVDWMLNPYKIGDKGYYGNLYINLGEMF